MLQKAHGFAKCWTCQYPFRPKEQGMKGGGFAALAPLKHLLWL